MARLRVARVQEAIQQEISKMLLYDIKDPRIRFVTVTGAKLNADMSVAKIYFTLYGSRQEQDEAWQGLHKALGFMRTELARRIRLRFAPALVLLKDTSREYGDHIQNILDQIKQGEGPANE